MEKNSKPIKKDNHVNDDKGLFSLSEMQCTDILKSFNENAENISIVGFAGEDYAFIAVNVPEDVDKNQALHRVARRLIMASTGCQCRTAALASLMRARLYMNEYMRQRIMKPRCVALLLSCLLTNGIQDPKSTSFMIAGLDDKGKGVIYAYDLLGYHERTQFRAMGAAKVFLQLYLRNYVYCKSISIETKIGDTESIEEETGIDFETALGMVVKAFKAAAKRNDVYTSNKLVISGITKEGICLEEINLW